MLSPTDQQNASSRVFGAGDSLGEPNYEELRAGERVLQYLLAEFDRPDLKEGSRLPTNKILAQRLRVSVGTVRGVMRQLAKEGRVKSRRGSGTYLLSLARTMSARRVGVGTPLNSFSEVNGWTSQIGGGIFQMALKEHITLEGVSKEAFGNKAMIQELMDKKESLSALMVLPYTIGPQHEFLIEKYESLGKPVVRIFPPSLTATANFVSTDFFGSSYVLGRTWRVSGRRKILIVTNQSETGDQHLNVSSQLRFAGLAAGLGADLGARVTLQTITTPHREMSEEAGYKIVKEFLQDRQSTLFPDAVYCAGDWLAVGTMRALREFGLRCPADVSVVGGSGLDMSHTEFPSLTRIRHNLEEIGRKAMTMVTQRLALHGHSLPGVIIPTHFLGGATTRPEENALLGLAHMTSTTAPETQ